MCPSMTSASGDSGLSFSVVHWLDSNSHVVAVMLQVYLQLHHHAAGAILLTVRAQATLKGRCLQPIVFFGYESLGCLRLPCGIAAPLFCLIQRWRKLLVSWAFVRLHSATSSSPSCGE